MYLLPSSDPRLALILHPKTGTRSIEQAITRGPGGRCLGGRHKVIQSALDDFKAAGGLVAGTVRNPFDTLVSWYHHVFMRRAKYPAFGVWLPEFLDAGNSWVRPGQPLFYGAERMDRVIRFESCLESQLNAVLAEAGLPAVSLPHVGAAENRGQFRDYYCCRTIDAVYKRFESDFVRFGYSFGE